MKILINHETSDDPLKQAVIKEAAKRLARIFDAVISERRFQTEKYGHVYEPTFSLEGGEQVIDGWVQSHGGHEIGAWAIILEKELDELKDAIVHGGKHATGRDTARAELVQIAAVAIAALEQHGLEG